MAVKNKIKKVIPVEEKLKALYSLQIIDTEIDKIRIVRGELPLEIQDLEDSIEGFNTRLDKFNTELSNIKEAVVANNQTIS